MLLFEKKKTDTDGLYQEFRAIAKHHLIKALSYAEQNKAFGAMREYGASASVMAMYSWITGLVDLWEDDDIGELTTRICATEFNGIPFLKLDEIVIEEFQEIEGENGTYN